MSRIAEKMEKEEELGGEKDESMDYDELINEKFINKKSHF